MIKRHIQRRYRRNPAEAPSNGRTARRPAVACAELDAESFEQLVQARVRKLFGVSIERLAPDPLLRQMLYDIIAEDLREPPRAIPPDVLELVARLREDGITATPGTC